MKKLNFRTNINCSGCIGKISSTLDASSAIKSWSVDTAHPDKILTVETVETDAQQIINLVKNKGFSAEEFKDESINKQ